MESHREELHFVCRLGTDCIIDRRAISKLVYSEELERVYGIDVWNDDDDIHPMNVCDKHRAALNRVKKSLKENKDAPITSKPIPFVFNPHTNDNCDVCCRTSKQRAGRPVKSSESHLYTCMSEFGNLNEEDLQNFLVFMIQHLCEEQFMFLSYLMGKGINKFVKATSISLRGQYKTIESLSRHRASDCVDNANPALVCFLKAASGLTELTTTKQLHHLARVIEGIYQLCEPNLITPLAFLTNLHCYVESGSRNIVDLIGATTGGGSYCTIKDWLDNLASKPPQVTTKDVGHALDNNQKVGKAWKVSVNNNKFSSSVITTHLWFPLGDTCLQNDPNLKPIQWVKDRNIIDKIRREEDPIFKELDDIHMESLTYFIEASIKLVDSEQQGTEIFTDKIDRVIEERLTVECNSCLKNGITISYPKSKRKCDICQAALTRRVSKVNKLETVNNSIIRVEVKNNVLIKTVIDDNPILERYSQIPANIPTLKPTLKTGDPSFVDPNSFSSCTVILRKIGREAGIITYGTGNRQWLIICCDGLPFRLCHVIINNTYMCSECKVSLFKEEEVSLHEKEMHPNKRPKLTKEFDWVLLKPAGGHFEMNSIKSFFELNWETFLEKLCDVMGYKSEPAKYVAKTCKDHHKAWELILIFFFASLRELVTIYVRETKSSPSANSLSASGFFEFTKIKTKNPSFLYLFSQVTTYAFAIINFRMGVRRNNYKVTLSAVHKLGGLFHDHNHPYYQLIEVYYISRLFTLQKDVELLYQTYYTISVPGDPSRAEDWDFVLENVNKKTQSWIPRACQLTIFGKLFAGTLIH